MEVVGVASDEADSDAAAVTGAGAAEAAAPCTADPKSVPSFYADISILFRIVLQ